MDFKRVRMVVAMLALAAATCRAQPPDFIRLFNTHTLEGWIQRGGQAKYEVVNEMIVGTAVPNSPNSFLCTTREYSDFILELDLKVDDGLNSGIQIRSHYTDQAKVVHLPGADGRQAELTIPARCVYGYQVEIDPSERAFSGGIYDEARRGWLFDLAGETHRPAREAFRRNAWNHYRIEAVGQSIKTWVNGIPVAEMSDDLDSSGFIALQVHSVDHEQPLHVRWRNIWIKELPRSP